MKARSLLVLALIVFFAGSISAENGAIDENLLKSFKSKTDKEPNKELIINAVTNNKINDISLNREKVVNHSKLFSHKLKSSGITDQASSGRCWAFAGTNLFSPKVMTKLQLADFEISQAYIAFYDKLEKSNFFLERIIELRDKPLTDRSMEGLISYMFGDGGWWHYFLGLIDKYGIVPKEIMPETKQSAATGMVNNLGKTLLRSYASELRTMHENGKSVKDLRKRKDEMLAEVYKLLIYNYGTPPTDFVYRYEYKDKEDTLMKEKIIIENEYTPKSFYNEFFGENMPEYVAIVDNPTMEYNKLYRMEASRNIYENADFEVINLPIEKLKAYTRQSLLDSQAVWFACDVGQENYRDDAIMKTGIYDYEKIFGIDFSMTKKERLAYEEISPTHAMVITGVDTTKSGENRKWLVENSWGKKAGDDGFWYMYDDWFTEYVLLVIVDKNMLSDEDKKLFDSKPQIIADWEPFFLALRNIE